MLGVDTTTFEQDGVGAGTLIELSEDDFETLGTGKTQARLLAAEVLDLKKGLLFDVDAADPVLAASATILLRRLSDENQDTRAEALKCLARSTVRDPRLVSPVLLALTDEHACVRRAAAGALAALAPRGNPRAVEAVGKALRDADAGVRRAAVEALQVVVAEGDRNLALSNALTVLLEDADMRVRAAAAAALGVFKKGDEDVLWGLEHKMTHGGLAARVAAVKVCVCVCVCARACVCVCVCVCMCVCVWWWWWR